MRPRVYHTEKPQCQFGKEAGSLELALPAPLSRSGLGCTLEPANIPLAPPLLYFDIFPKEEAIKQGL